MPFDGIVLTDTFQMHEEDDTLDRDDLRREQRARRAPASHDIRVIVGNPPYSVGQDSANDDNANLKYPTLDESIEATYAARHRRRLNKKSSYDSYIRAIRWARDRIGTAASSRFVTNGGFIDSNTADGLRHPLVDEFDRIYVYNLRGNQRTAGEQSRKEGGKVFGQRQPRTVAIIVPRKGSRPPTVGQAAAIHYRDIGDYLTRDQKLAIVAGGSVATVPWQELTPNAEGDWINHRNLASDDVTPLGSRDGLSESIFSGYTLGLSTSRDAWVYNSSQSELLSHVKLMISVFNEQVEGFREYRANSPGNRIEGP